MPAKRAILSQIERGQGFSVRAQTTSGMIPKPRRSLRAFWAGLVFSSLEVLIKGT